MKEWSDDSDSVVEGEWEYDPNSPIGPSGGFGAVFMGKGQNHEDVAVKRLHIDVNEAAHRELRIADELVQRPLDHVIPVLDAGRDAESDHYFVVMARAEKSLQQEINRLGRFSEGDAVRILRDIALGLAEVRDIVHRDLKPPNILHHEGQWKIADFGIARFVEESTSPRTRKGFLTPDYAAPEQWNLERATAATDIYALGCIAYALLTGRPPFPGPTPEDFQHQHLHVEQPPLEAGHPRLRSLILSMLRKPPQARPSLDRVIQQLDAIEAEAANVHPRQGIRFLEEAGADAVEATARAEAVLLEQQARYNARDQLAKSAFKNLVEIILTLFQRIQDAAPTAHRPGDQLDILQLQLDHAMLRVVLLFKGTAIPEGAFKESGWDVVAGASITVEQNVPHRYEWSASL